MTAAKRAMSILLSAAMLMGNMVAPITVLAEEAVTEGNEVYETPVKKTDQPQPVTETPDYLVTVPYYMEAAFMGMRLYASQPGQIDQGRGPFRYR